MEPRGPPPPACIRASVLAWLARPAAGWRRLRQAQALLHPVRVVCRAMRMEGDAGSSVHVRAGACVYVTGRVHVVRVGGPWGVRGWVGRQGRDGPRTCVTHLWWYRHGADRASLFACMHAPLCMPPAGNAALQAQVHMVGGAWQPCACIDDPLAPVCICRLCNKALAKCMKQHACVHACMAYLCQCALAPQPHPSWPSSPACEHA